jgi:hypothetical protein
MITGIYLLRFPEPDWKNYESVLLDQDLDPILFSKYERNTAHCVQLIGGTTVGPIEVIVNVPKGNFVHKCLGYFKFKSRKDAMRWASQKRMGLPGTGYTERINI